MIIMAAITLPSVAVLSLMAPRPMTEISFR
jgi:hypothetical protein